MKNFMLKDRLKHRAYSFPPTVLTYRCDGEMPNDNKDALFMDGQPTPYQTEWLPSGYGLKVLADLPYLGEHSFTWGKGVCGFENIGNDNGIFKITDIPDGLYEVLLVTGQKFEYKVDTALNLISCTADFSDGKIESVFVKTLTYENGATYKFTLKLKKDLDYLEIYEEIAGFKRGEASLSISWHNFSPSHRYTADRKQEKIDAYLGADGAFPFLINPFQPKTSWWAQRCVAYVDKEFGLWSGIILHDLKNFDDGEYRIWGSGDALAFTLYGDKIRGGLADGKRAFIHVVSDKPAEALSSHYLRFYSIVTLDKVKDYVLEWADEKSDYPKYFQADKLTRWGGFYAAHTGKPLPDDMTDIIDRDATMITCLENIAPVSCRALRTDWAQTFDLTAKQLSDGEFDRVRAIMALICYVFSDENYYPFENILGGHPNFLTDVAGTVAVFAALLGPKHPMFEKWLAYYEIVLARNFKYHTRPDVEAWQANGGRWTENVGAYMMTMLRAVTYDCHLIYTLYNGEMPALYPHLKSLIDFIINIQLPENRHGRRLYPPVGAHACTGAYGGEYGHGFALYMVQLAQMLRYFDPLSSEYLLNNFRKSEDYDGIISDAGIYGESFKPFAGNTFGTSPDLRSQKYTGFGYVLRDKPNTDREMCVILQQIDNGPNYRWGRAAQGGCGEIYYYAGGKSYTGHAPEDVGDENRGDVQSCTNFGVLIGHEYKSVGRNDLTEPLMDFGFVKYARVNASEYSAPYYKFRSVMMVENRYIAVYDAVGDMKQHGRFCWAQYKDSEFPLIKNLRPGKIVVTGESGLPIDRNPDYQSKFGHSKVMHIDGEGDFFTIVTHLRDFHDEKPLISVDKTAYGAELVFPQTRDRVFSDTARIKVNEDGYSFNGYVGYITEIGREIRLAVFDGESIGLDNIKVYIPYGKNVRHGISLIYNREEIYGKTVFHDGGEVRIVAPNLGKVFVDGQETQFIYDTNAYVFRVSKGYHDYNIGASPQMTEVSTVSAVNDINGATLEWRGVAGAESYEIFSSTDGEYTFSKLATVKASAELNSFKVENLRTGKYYFKIRGVVGNKTGKFGHAYPVYVTNCLPHPPEGLRIEYRNGKFLSTWGEVLGCNLYRLYKIEADKSKLVYEGRNRHSVVNTGSYFVTAVNNIGESNPSLTRSTDDEQTKWDNRPEKGFVRDTRSFEHGYSGFDYSGNAHRAILKYPDDNGSDGE